MKTPLENMPESFWVYLFTTWYDRIYHIHFAAAIDRAATSAEGEATRQA